MTSDNAADDVAESIREVDAAINAILIVFIIIVELCSYDFHFRNEYEVRVASSP